MKKVILIIVSILLVATVGISLVACNNATTQGQLEDVWYAYEQYTYKVTDGDNVGTYVVTVKWYGSGDVVVGNSTLTNVSKGYLVTGQLDIADTSYTTACYFKRVDDTTFLLPTASYRKQVVNGNTTLEINANYNDSNFDYNGTIDGNAVSGSISSLTSPYYDNNEFHQVLRSVSTMSTSFSFSFNVPIVAGNEASAVSLTASCSSTDNVHVPVIEGETECYVITLSRSTKVEGKTQTLYYTTAKLATDTNLDGVVNSSDYAPTRVLVKIVEPTATGSVVYELQSMSFSE